MQKIFLFILGSVVHQKQKEIVQKQKDQSQAHKTFFFTVKVKTVTQVSLWINLNFSQVFTKAIVALEHLDLFWLLLCFYRAFSCFEAWHC